MGMTDAYTKEYMKRSEVFAEVYNFLLGKNVVDPDKLRPIDVEELYLGEKMPKDLEQDIIKFRDVMKEYATAMTDGKTSYVLLGIENQTEIDYSFPVRVLIYDAIRYYKQLSEISRKHKKERNKRQGGEFMASFFKEDRLKPVITVVVYYGSKPWDAKCELFGLFEDGYEEFRPLMNNYQIKVFEASNMTDEQLAKFETDLRLLMSFIKYSDDAEKLEQIVSRDEGFQHMDLLTARVINSVTKSNLEINDEEATVDMCQAIRQIRQSSRAEGIVEGLNKGKLEGKLEGELNQKRIIAENMLKNGFSRDMVAQCILSSLEELEKLVPSKQA